MGFMEWMFGGGATKGMQTQPQTADYQRDYLKNFAGQSMDRSQVDQSRGQQGQLADMLFKTANGQQAGPGELAVQRQVGHAMADQTARASMARGAGAAMAARNAARSSADIGVNGAGQAGLAQMQDVNNAQGQLGQLLGTMRQQDLGTVNAQQQQGQLGLNALAQMLGVDQAALQQDYLKRNMGMQDKGMFPTLLQTGGQILGAYAGGGLGGAAAGGGAAAAGGGNGGGGGGAPAQYQFAPGFNYNGGGGFGNK